MHESKSQWLVAIHLILIIDWTNEHTTITAKVIISNIRNTCSSYPIILPKTSSRLNNSESNFGQTHAFLIQVKHLISSQGSITAMRKVIFHYTPTSSQHLHAHAYQVCYKWSASLYTLIYTCTYGASISTNFPPTESIKVEQQAYTVLHYRYVRPLLLELHCTALHLYRVNWADAKLTY